MTATSSEIYQKRRKAFLRSSTATVLITLLIAAGDKLMCAHDLYNHDVDVN
jgi:hypothetical protein